MLNIASWRTTVLGFLALAGALVGFGTALLDGDPATQPDLDKLLLAAAGAGLMAARDNGVTSERAGAQ